MTIEDFERQIIGALLAGDDPVLAALREQYIVSSVRDRELNATGWYYGTKKYPGITRELLAERDLEELLEED